MLSGTVDKNSSSMKESFGTMFLKAIANTYVMHRRRPKVYPTEAVAETIPFIITMSSGRERSIRIILESRARRNKRSMAVGKFNPPPPLRYVMRAMRKGSHKYRVTRAVSNTNHASRQQFTFFWKAMKRKNHSKK